MRLKKLEVRMPEAPDQQIPLTDLDARSMATKGSRLLRGELTEEEKALIAIIKAYGGGT